MLVLTKLDQAAQAALQEVHNKINKLEAETWRQEFAAVRGCNIQKGQKIKSISRFEVPSVVRVLEFCVGFGENLNCGSAPKPRTTTKPLFHSQL